MFELIDEPRLKELQQKVASLELESNEADGRVAQLRVAVRDAREQDLTAEALALNAGKSAPKRKEPELKAQLDGAERRLEVLRRRQALAQADVSKFVQQHHARLYGLLDQAQQQEARKVAQGAQALLSDLSRYYQIDEDRKRMKPMLPQPEPESQEAQPLTQYILGINTHSVMGGPGPQRGEIEQVLAYLASLGERAEEDEGAA